ncbi:MAG TPA: tetratricopeptide repeat protein [Alphaproteobacteria bacterium]|nr:tetratricopeptide repeat protein [Alphaproteobacteria bacterium]
MQLPDASLSFQDALNHHRAGRLDAAAQVYRRTLATDPDNMEAAFNLAALLVEEGAHDEAATIYRGLLERQPDDGETLSNLGNALQRAGRLDEAEDCYRRAIEADPFLAAAHGNLANLLMRQGEPEAALACYEAALDIDPFEALTYNNYGTALMLLERREEARAQFEQALQRDPQLADAHKNMGNLLQKEERPEEAEAHLRQALALAPDWAEARFDLAQALKAQDRLQEALALYRETVAAAPDYREAWLGLAGALIQDKDYDGAAAALDRAEALSPDDALTELYRGSLHQHLEQPEPALRHFERACTLSPGVPEFLNNYGNALLAFDRVARAIEVFEEAIAAAPDFAEALNNLGNACVKAGEPERAIACYERAVAIADPDATICCNLANVLRENNRLVEAERRFEEALARNPGLANAHNGLGLVYHGQARHHDAIAAFEAALALQPAYPEALNNLAVSLSDIGQYGKAVETYNRLLDIKPNLVEAHFNLGTLLQHLDRWDESIIAFHSALSVKPDYNLVSPYLAHSLMQQCNWGNLDAVVTRIRENTETELADGKRVSVSCFALQSMPGEFSMELRQKVAERLSETIETSVSELKQELNYRHAPRRRAKGERLRVGYLSPDFRFHSVAVAFKGILQAHDRDLIEPYGYSLHPGRDDHMTEELKAGFTGFTKVTTMSYREAAERIRSDGIDILVDLAGHTRGARLELLALRPAPIQAHYLGYSATLGARFVDYLITDHHQAPPEARPFFTEQLCYLPDTFMATQRAPVAVQAPGRADCGLPEGAFVFANFNAHYKFEPRMFGIWMRLLRKRPDAVLWMMAGSPGSQRNLRKEAAARGVDPERLVFAGREPHPVHLARMQHADLALDNLYHGGGVTTVDALWTGLPVLTLAGQTPQSRNGASLLAPIGLDDLITYRLEDYERLALMLASEPGRLAALRERLRRNRDTHPLFDSKRLTRHLERAYEMMWDNHAAGRPPTLIGVPVIDDIKA